MAKKRPIAVQVIAEAKPAEPVAPPAPELVLVRSPHGAPFWERHPAHPGGEVWVAGNQEQPGPAAQVALTAAVERALKEGRLERA
jgi:hypothetical protein